ncbi:MULTISPECIES: heparan-alpha-glucosaminide N-acetyltransferase domain-containing protein [unclassified Agrococcus]|uniref:heparan-alpha-glucosaminide N-acetyltransferase domain-containing protein n=1 Tax=unclassified Agrococcus TaxID=2615065 RepID=UPI00360ED570
MTQTRAAVGADVPEPQRDRRTPQPAPVRSTPLRRLPSFGRPPRVMGVDVARGVAVVGMLGAHVGVTEAFDWARVETWTDVVHGRSSLLFALVAGISVALLAGGTRRPTDAALPRLRLRLVGRGAVVFAIGCSLELLGTGVSVVLTVYGILFVAIIPFLRWRRRSLWIAAAAFALLGPLALALVRLAAGDPYGEGIALVLGPYPITAWLPLLLAGLAIGRTDLLRARTAVALLAGGALATAVGYGAGALAIPPLEAWASGDLSATPVLARLVELGIPLRPLWSLVEVAPHSGATLEIVGSGGLAAAIVGACLLLARPLRWVLLPLAALGSMPLTAYSAQLVVIALIGGLAGAAALDGAMWPLLTGALLVATTAWMAVLGAGPLERLARRASAWMAGATSADRA